MRVPGGIEHWGGYLVVVVVVVLDDFGAANGSMNFPPFSALTLPFFTRAYITLVFTSRGSEPPRAVPGLVKSSTGAKPCGSYTNLFMAASVAARSTVGRSLTAAANAWKPNHGIFTVSPFANFMLDDAYFFTSAR